MVSIFGQNYLFISESKMSSHADDLIKLFKQGFHPCSHLVRHGNQIRHLHITPFMKYSLPVDGLQDLKKYSNSDHHHVFLFDDGHLFSVFIQPDHKSAKLNLLTQKVHDFELRSQELILINYLNGTYHIGSIKGVYDFRDVTQRFSHTAVDGDRMKGLIFSFGSVVTHNSNEVYVANFPNNNQEKPTFELLFGLMSNGRVFIKQIGTINKILMVENFMTRIQMIVALDTNGQLWIVNWRLNTHDSILDEILHYLELRVTKLWKQLVNLNFTKLQQHRETEMLLFGRDHSLYHLTFLDLDPVLSLIPESELRALDNSS